MISKSLNWMRRNMKSARFAAILSFVALIVAFGVVQASGPMRPPHPPGGMGMWGQMRKVWYPMEPVPTIKILAVVRDQSVTFETNDFPEDEEFTVTMGQMYTRGVNGIEVGTFNSGDGSSSQETFDIPEELQGNYKISIRAQSGHDFPYYYYSFNWFYNNTTEAVAVPAADDGTGDAAATSEVETEEVETEEAETEEAQTEEPAEAEAEESESEAAADDLTGQVWQWVQFSDPVQGVQAIDNPQNYQVEFLPEGGMNIQADCNMGTGSYTAEGQSLTVSIGAMTLAQCQEGSLGDDFVNYLSAAAVYFFDEDNLGIDLFADSGTMIFQAAGAETAEEGVGTGGAEETEEAAEAAEGEAAETEETEEAAEAAEGEAAETEETEETAEAAEGEAAETEEAEGEAEEAAETGLVGGVWQWAELSDPVEGVVAIDSPEKYTAEFLDDGTVNVQADCNSGRGNYEADGSNITISDLAMTRALCEPDSLSDDFVNYLTAAAIYFFEDVNLFFDLPADSGTMKFDPAESEETASAARSFAMKAARQDEAEEVPVPSFKVCAVAKDTEVFIVTADFPEDQVFNVTMGPVLVAQPVKPMYGPMPMQGYEPYKEGPMKPMGQPGMGQPGMGQPGMGQPGMGQPGMGQPGMGQMDMGQPGMGQMNMSQPAMGQFDLSMSMGSMGKGEMGGTWGKPMAPKTYVPFYYEAGTLESVDGGTIEATLAVPEELAGYYRIQIMLRTDHQYPYYAYNWFYNNDAEVCDEENGG